MIIFNYYSCHRYLPLILVICSVGSCLALSENSQPPPAAKPSGHQLPPPTPDDEAAKAWFDRQGILTNNLKLLTTSQSIGGRGVFYSGDRPANVGDLLAFIPSKSVLTSSIGGQRYPDLKQKLGASDSGKRLELEWPMVLTAYVLRSIADEDGWAELALTWQGVPTFASRPLKEYTDQEIADLSNMARSSSKKIREVLQVRVEDLQKQSRRLSELVGDDAYDDDVSKLMGDVYEGILSRAIALSHTEDSERGYGVVPLQDMTNHHNVLEKNNVALYSVGAIRRMTSEAVEPRLVQTFGWKEDSAKDSDLCLVAIRPVMPGHEILNSYTGWDEDPPEDRRVWKLLQYGFPMA